MLLQEKIQLWKVLFFELMQADQFYRDIGFDFQTWAEYKSKT